MREACTEQIYEYAKNDPNVMALTADSRNGVYAKIMNGLPRQYMDYGIAEQNMIASAAGLAVCGKIPFIFGASTFLAMRGFEFIRNDVCIANANVKFIGIFSGLSRPSWGATHEGTEEVTLLSCLPNLVVITPSTPLMAKKATQYAYHHRGPVYIRLEASNEPEYYSEHIIFEPGKGYLVKEGSDFTIISMGSVIEEAFGAANRLAEEGVSIRIIDMPTVRPIDQNLIIDAARETRGIITLEEHSIYGGLGSAVAEVLAENGISTQFRRIGLCGCAVGCGSREAVRAANGLSKDHLIHAVREVMG